MKERDDFNVECESFDFYIMSVQLFFVSEGARRDFLHLYDSCNIVHTTENDLFFHPVFCLHSAAGEYYFVAQVKLTLAGLEISCLCFSIKNGWSIKMYHCSLLLVCTACECVCVSAQAARFNDSGSRCCN